MEKRQKMCRVGVRAVSSFIGTCGFCYVAELAGSQNASYSSLGVVVFLVLWRLCETTRENPEPLAKTKE